MTLEDILVEYFGLKDPQDEAEWMKAYSRLIRCICYVGALTGCLGETGRIITVIDKIDTQNGEI